MIAGYAAALGMVLAISLVFRNFPHFNQTTVAFTFLLGILGASALWGLGVSVFMSLAATLSYNFFPASGWHIYNRRSAKLGRIICVSCDLGCG